MFTLKLSQATPSPTFGSGKGPHPCYLQHGQTEKGFWKRTFEKVLPDLFVNPEDYFPQQLTELENTPSWRINVVI